MAAPAGCSSQLPTDTEDLVAQARSSAWRWTRSCVLASLGPIPLLSARGDSRPRDGWMGYMVDGLLPCTTPHPPGRGIGAGKPWLVPWALRVVPPGRLSPWAPPGTAPARCVAPVPSGELPLPVLPLPALPNNGGPGSSGCSFEFKCGQPLVYKNNKSPSNRVM